MEYSDLIRERYSVRAFSDQPMEESKVTAILEAARAAPTAANKQPQRLLVLRDAASLEKLKACTTYSFGAPMAIAVCYCKDKAWVRPYDGDNAGVIDAAIVGTHIMLAIHNAGLGATWVGHFDPAAFRKNFNLPENMIPAAIFPFGYPAPDAKPSPMHAQRLPLAETVAYNSF